MAQPISVRKYIKVWVEKRKNPPKKNGKQTVSYTLEWVLHGKRHFMSLGPGATRSYAEAMARAKEAELNNASPEEGFKPITWADFREKYLNTFYPGHDLSTEERKKKEPSWGNAIATMREERRVLNTFEQLVKPGWCHDITTEEREEFIRKRLPQVASPGSVDKDLRLLRHLFNILEEWKHCRPGTNPFSGNGKATIGAKRRKAKELERRKSGGEKPRFYTVPQVRALLAQADKDILESPDDWCRKRLRALLYFEAYTGARLDEVLHLEWDEIDFEQGVAWLNFKIENHLKTEGSEAPVGLADPLLAVLREWETERTCSWVFPNKTNQSPWTGGSPGYKPLDQLKELAERAGVEHATWQMFRHTLSTIGKGEFGLSEGQVQAQLRHTTTKTQKHYTHDYLDGLRRTANTVDFRSR